jgi:hypothetical protein
MLGRIPAVAFRRIKSVFDIGKRPCAEGRTFDEGAALAMEWAEREGSSVARRFGHRSDHRVSRSGAVRPCRRGNTSRRSCTLKTQVGPGLGRAVGRGGCLAGSTGRCRKLRHRRPWLGGLTRSAWSYLLPTGLTGSDGVPLFGAVQRSVVFLLALAIG